MKILRYHLNDMKAFALGTGILILVGVLAAMGL